MREFLRGVPKPTALCVGFGLARRAAPEKWGLCARVLGLRGERHLKNGGSVRGFWVCAENGT